MKTRVPIIAANWKMHKTASEAKLFIETLIAKLPPVLAQIFIAPPFTALHAAAGACKTPKVLIGAQNMHEKEFGAYTGEISATLLKEAGARFVILGHSERRHLFHEENAQINQKLKTALKEGLLPILCVGETERERAEGKTAEVISAQLEACLKEISPSEIILAYEPVWAIGTGITATPEMAEKTHLLCREFLSAFWGESAAERINILYGGSVTPETAAALFKQPNIDGALVGGASLQCDKFIQIIQGLL